MPTYALPTETSINFSSGADSFFVYIASQLPFFFPLVLFAFTCIVWLAGSMMQKRSSGRAASPLWFGIATFMQFLVATILLITDGIITKNVYFTSLAFAVLGMVVALSTRGNT